MTKVGFVGSGQQEAFHIWSLFRVIDVSAGVQLLDAKKVLAVWNLDVETQAHGDLQDSGVLMFTETSICQIREVPPEYNILSGSRNCLYY